MMLLLILQGHHYSSVRPAGRLSSACVQACICWAPFPVKTLELHCLLLWNQQTLFGSEVDIPVWQQRNAVLLPVTEFPKAEPESRRDPFLQLETLISDGRKVELFYSVQVLSTLSCCNIHAPSAPEHFPSTLPLGKKRLRKPEVDRKSR